MRTGVGVGSDSDHVGPKALTAAGSVAIYSHTVVGHRPEDDILLL